jgi:hypothetical protein
MASPNDKFWGQRVFILYTIKASKKILCNDYYILLWIQKDNDRHCKEDKEHVSGFRSQNED